MEVLNTTHYRLHVKQIYLAFASWVTTNQLPNLRKQYLLFFKFLWLDEAQVQEQLTHLRASYLRVDIIIF